MRIRFVWVGATRDARLKQLEAHYLDRIQRHLSVDRVAVPEANRKDPRQRTGAEEKEARLLEKRVLTPSRLLVLDHRGTLFSSREFADFIQKLRIDARDLTFVGGGFAGVPERIINQADRRISLGRMTFPHEVARVLLLEQVYRAATIIKGIPYHH